MEETLEYSSKRSSNVHPKGKSRYLRNWFVAIDRPDYLWLSALLHNLCCMREGKLSLEPQHQGGSHVTMGILAQEDAQVHDLGANAWRDSLAAKMFENFVQHSTIEEDEDDVAALLPTVEAVEEQNEML